MNLLDEGLISAFFTYSFGVEVGGYYLYNS